jgi:hypothetical protein
MAVHSPSTVLGMACWRSVPTSFRKLYLRTNSVSLVNFPVTGILFLVPRIRITGVISSNRYSTFNPLKGPSAKFRRILESDLFFDVFAVGFDSFDTAVQLVSNLPST